VYLTICSLFLQAVEPLLDTIKRYSSAETITYCCYEVRDIGGPVASLQKFTQLVSKWFQVESAKENEFDNVYRSPEIVLLKLRLKAV